MNIGIVSPYTLGELIGDLFSSEDMKTILDNKLVSLTTVEDVLTAIDAKGLLEKYSDVEVGGTITVGEAVDFLAGNPDVQARADTEITVKTTVGKLIDIVGEDKVKTFLEEKAAAASFSPDYVYEESNVIGYWMHLIQFALVFALLATITLEFIDKDKR